MSSMQPESDRSGIALSRSCQVRAIGSLATVIGLIPGLAQAQITAEFGPRGEVRELRSGSTVYFQDIAVSLIKPKWAGPIVDQRTLEPASVKVERSPGITVYSATLTGEGHTIRLRETARVATDKVTLEYEITPEQTVETEVVLLQGTMPAAIHAGKTDYLVIEGVSATRGTCPANLNSDSYVLFGGVAADWARFAWPGGPALRVTPGGLNLQLQDDRKWNTAAFALLATHEGGRLAAGKPIRFNISYAAEAPEQIEAAVRQSKQGGLAL